MLLQVFTLSIKADLENIESISLPEDSSYTLTVSFAETIAWAGWQYVATRALVEGAHRQGLLFMLGILQGQLGAVQSQKSTSPPCPQPSSPTPCPGQGQCR